MIAEGAGRLVILSGPSCVGKSPLAKALGRFHRDLSAKLQPIVLFNSRAPRPGERDGEDYHFRAREQIETLRDRAGHVVMDVRGDLQALDLEDLSALLQKGDAFFEGNPFIGRTLRTHPKLQDVNRLSMFLSPLSREELLFLRKQARVSMPDLVADVMRRKLVRRAAEDLPLAQGLGGDRTPRRKRLPGTEGSASFRVRDPQPRWRGQRQLGGVLLPIGRRAPSLRCGRGTPAWRRREGSRAMGGGLASVASARSTRDRVPPYASRPVRRPTRRSHGPAAR